jgi:Sulfotransferase domain
MTIQVIGAGIGRTGTASLKLALEQLGFAKCYHMDEIGTNPAHVPLWLDAAAGKPVDWDALFAGYQAAVDLPTYAFYVTLMTHYPKAKVILTLREPEAWYKSAAQTIFRLPPPPLVRVLRMMALFSPKLKLLTNLEPVARKVGIEYFFNNDLSKANAIKVFNQHNETVQRTVPPDRLLVYDVKQGWEPLCTFLDVPVPALPFPHQNTLKEFASRRA